MVLGTGPLRGWKRKNNDEKISCFTATVRPILSVRRGSNENVILCWILTSFFRKVNHKNNDFHKNIY